MLWRTDSPVEETVERLEARVPEMIREAGLPGLSISLIRGGQLAWSRGFGFADVGSREPVTADTVFEAASLSKPVFAYIALKLCETGVLDIDAPLIEYLPVGQRAGSPLVLRPRSDVPRHKLRVDEVINEPRLHMISVRHVLTHSTGFPNWPPDGSPLAIHSTPGERFAYSGAGFVYLHRVIEHATGQPGVEYAKASLLEPFGMHRSSYVWTGCEGWPVALPYDDDGRALRKELWPTMNAAGSLHCTSADYARFMAEVMQPSGDDRFHLGPDWVEQMLRPQVPVNDSVSWGLGWGMQHHAEGYSFWHWGRQKASYTAFAVGCRDNGIGAVIMGNNHQLERIREELLVEAIGGEYPAISWLGSSD